MSIPVFYSHVCKLWILFLANLCLHLTYFPLNEIYSGIIADDYYSLVSWRQFFKEHCLKTIWILETILGASGRPARALNWSCPASFHANINSYYTVECESRKLWDSSQWGERKWELWKLFKLTFELDLVYSLRNISIKKKLQIKKTSHNWYV